MVGACKKGEGGVTHSRWNLRGRAEGAMMEKGYPHLSGLEPSLWYFPFMAAWGGRLPASAD